MLLWIQDAPVIGVDDADKVLAWIEDRITCKLPDKESDPELHAMVTNTNCTNAVDIANAKSSVGEFL